MTLIELKKLIAKKLGIALRSISAEDFKAYGVRFHYLGSSYRATTDLTVEKVDGAWLVTDDDARSIEKLLRSEEWDGEGLPPVGCECEYETKFDGWRPVRIELIKSEGIAFTWLSNSQACNGLDCVGVQKAGSFRPIRSEADKKRDEAVKAMVLHKDDQVDVTENYYHAIYDAIAAGKIPHIRID